MKPEGCLSEYALEIIASESDERGEITVEQLHHLAGCERCLGVLKAIKDHREEVVKSPRFEQGLQEILELDAKLRGKKK